jgi:hypothetical protein
VLSNRGRKSTGGLGGKVGFKATLAGEAAAQFSDKAAEARLAINGGALQ